MAVDDITIILDRLYYGYTRDPFWEFRIVTKAGAVFRIDRPSTLSWRNDRPVWLGIRQRDGRWVMISTDEVSDVIFESREMSGRIILPGF